MDENLIRQLRQMFLDGATPSRLMRHVADHHGEDERLHFVIKDYFEEAFGIGLLRYVASDEDYSPDPRHAHFNRDVVPEIVEHLRDWNPEPTAGSWLERASVSSLDEHVQRAKAGPPDELASVWSQLSDEQRLAIVRRIARKNRDWEVIKVLALLAERLQQKVVELEARLKDQPIPQSADGGD
jgi:hypothetical protein